MHGVPSSSFLFRKAIRVDREGRRAAELTKTELQTVPGKHFFPEEQPVAIAERVGDLTRG